MDKDFCRRRKPKKLSLHMWKKLMAMNWTSLNMLSAIPFQSMWAILLQFSAYLQKPQINYLSFYEPDLWAGSFEIKADLNNNIVYDGYKNWYLLGGTVLQHNNSVYADTGYAIQKPLANKAMAENICASADQLSVSPSLRYKTGTAEGGFGSVLIEPQLDPQKEYSLDRLAKDYGEFL